jgi:beta-glucuronidase
MKRVLRNILRLQASGFRLQAFVLACSMQLAACSPVLFAQDRPNSGELITKSWEAHGRNDIEATFKYTQQLIELYSLKADKEQASLKALPKSQDEINAVSALNDVATAYFIQAESYMRQQETKKAKETFKLIIDQYPFAQAWDQRGWYWIPAEAAAQSIKKIETGSIEVEKKLDVSQLPTKIVLFDAGSEDFVDYAKYGEFIGTGTKDYLYQIKDQKGLSAAVGEGIYPNTGSVRADPELAKAKKAKRLTGSHWDLLQSPDQEAAFLKWALIPEPPGTTLFYTGLLLEKAGLIKHAIKAYYAIIVHFPGAHGWTYWHTPWYVGQAAISKIKFLLKENPKLGFRLADADIKIINGFDNDVSNDIAVVNPGRFEKIAPPRAQKAKPKAQPQVKQKRGSGKVHLVKYADESWQLVADEKPYIIKGITYAPTKVGQSPDEGTLGNWMEEDFNKNAKTDGPYDSFVDKNRNNLQDKNEPAVGDFKLMKEMGVNTIRLYHHPQRPNKELLRKMYQDYGIRVILGDFLGKYAIGSGAPWYPGTDYKNEEHKKNMMQSVVNMVMEFKDEPYILFWLLGNENVYGFACNADKEPEAFFKFANEVARQIKRIDPEHPVGICNGDVVYLDILGRNCPDIDIFGINAYRGNYGFGFLWQQIKEETARPAFITEFGCPAYYKGKSSEEAEGAQAQYHRAAWEDIAGNMAFQDAAGNALGGVVFEWLDEWWKAYEPARHDTKGLWAGPFPDGYMHEEWLGVCGQGDGNLSPFLRQLRKSYYIYKKMWR